MSSTEIDFWKPRIGCVGNFGLAKFSGQLYFLTGTLLECTATHLRVKTIKGIVDYAIVDIRRVEWLDSKPSQPVEEKLEE